MTGHLCIIQFRGLLLMYSCITFNLGPQSQRYPGHHVASTQLVEEYFQTSCLVSRFLYFRQTIYIYILHIIYTIYIYTHIYIYILRIIYTVYIYIYYKKKYYLYITHTHIYIYMYIYIYIPYKSILHKPGRLKLSVSKSFTK